jgi:hypothetical protein
MSPKKFKASLRFITVFLFVSLAAFIFVEMLKLAAK